jgi:chaperone modulatory protein CbpM
MAEQPEAVWLASHTRVTLVELAQCSGLAEATLRELVEYGALYAETGETFAGECVGRLRHAARLGQDLELETPAIAILLRFLERIEALEAQVRHLDAQVARPRR